MRPQRILSTHVPIFRSAKSLRLENLNSFFRRASNIKIWLLTIAILAAGIAGSVLVYQRIYANHIALIQERLHGQAEHQRLRERAIESSQNRILIVDARKEGLPITFCNSAVQRLTGYAAAEVIGRNCSFLQAGDLDQPEIQPYAARYQKLNPCLSCCATTKKTARCSGTNCTSIRLC